MDFKEQINELGHKVKNHKNAEKTNEEATKHGFILPFITKLGYDIYNIKEIKPEYTADVGDGIKQGERVDYAILKDGEPILLIECKDINTELNKKHIDQLYRYFNTTKAKFSILTNGKTYNFYSDIDEINKMDKEPFFSFDVDTINDEQISILQNFCKEEFDCKKILKIAKELKYKRKIEITVKDELAKPSNELLEFFIRKAYNRRLTEKTLKEYNFHELTKNSIKNFIGKKENEKNLNNEIENNKIYTTEDERIALYIVKAILCEKISADKINLRDRESYCNILYDDNAKKWICRLRLSENRKILSFPTNDKSEEKIEISDISELYKYKNKILQSALIYCEQK